MDYLSLMESNSSYLNQSRGEISVYDQGMSETPMAESKDLDKNHRHAVYDEYHELEALDEQNQAEENAFSVISNESNEHN